MSQGRLGRTPTPPVELPDIDYEAEALADFLKERDGPQRHPIQTAKVLALAAALHLDGMRPWPIRKQIQEHTGVSLPMIDVVMSQRQASKDIRIWNITKRGNIKTRDSTITLKLVKPSPQILEAFEKARDQRAEANSPPKRSVKRQKSKESMAGIIKPLVAIAFAFTMACPLCHWAACLHEML